MRVKFILFEISVVVISLFCLFPLLTSMTIFRLATVMASVYIFSLSFREVLRKSNLPILKVIFVFFCSSIFSFILENKHSFNFFLYQFIFLVFVFASEWYRIKGMNLIKRVSIIIVFFLVISLLQTIIALISNPSYARALTKNQEELEVIGFSGGYGLVYASLLFLISTVLLIKKNSKVNFFLKGLLSFSLVTVIVTIWKAGFFLALLLLVLGLVFILIGVDRTRIVKTIFFIFFIFGLSFFFKDSLSNLVIEQTVGTKYEQKIKSIFESSGSSNEFDERETRYLRDVNLMLEYPVVGCWQFTLVGKHSFILDTLAQFGLVFGIFFIYSVFMIPYRCLVESNNIGYTQSFVFFGVLLVFLTLNSFVISIIPIITIIFPYSNYIINSNEQN